MKEPLERVLAPLEQFRASHWRRPDPLDPHVDGWGLSPDDVDATLVDHRPSPLLFGAFSGEQVMADLERSGILAVCRARGYKDLAPLFSGSDAFETRFSLAASHPALEGRCRLIDIRTRQGEMRLTDPFEDGDVRARALVLDWISMQDPAHPLAPDRVALPGQRNPGLGVFRKAYRLTLRYLRRTDFDAVVNVPEFFHNAVLYARDFSFFSPQRQGCFEAMQRDLLPYGLARASRALSPDDSDVPSGAPAGERVALLSPRSLVQWTPAEQILALSARMRAHARDPRFHATARQARTAHHYQLLTDL